jgi:hypothetical protein
MIQEILGCWWTKSTFLTATKEEILALASDENKLNYLARDHRDSSGAVHGSAQHRIQIMQVL